MVMSWVDGSSFLRAWIVVVRVVHGDCKSWIMTVVVCEWLVDGGSG